MASLLLALSIMFAMFSQYAGGELKNFKRNVPVSILGTLVLGALGMFLMGLVAAKTWGYDFLGSLHFLHYEAADAYPLAVPPSYVFLTSICTQNKPLIAIIGTGFTLWSIAAIIFNHLVNSRCIFSWSFDRIFPRKFSEVNDRLHSPIWAILLSFVVAEAFLIYYSFRSTVTFLAGTTLGYMLAFATTAVAGIVFPYKLKKLYNESPAKINIFGVPLIVIAGVIVILWFVYMIYTFLVNPVFGANAPEGLFFMLFLWVIGFVLFYIAKLIRKKSEGIDIDLAYKELPPE
jgi:amino acid transporter